MPLRINGQSVHAFIHTASRDKPTFVLIHGGGLDRTSWLPAATRLARMGIGVVAPDLPGHGGSEGPALDTIPAMAMWVLGLLKSLPLQRPYLAGHSMGAMIALECTARLAREPDADSKIRGLAMLGTAFPLTVSTKLLDLLSRNESEAQTLVNRWSHAKSRIDDPDTQDQLKAVMDRNLACMQSQKSGVLLSDLIACNAYSKGLEQAENICCPVLMLLGEEDRMTPPIHADRLVETFRKVTSTELALVSNAGHNLMGEKPDQVAESLIKLHADTLFS